MFFNESLIFGNGIFFGFFLALMAWAIAWKGWALWLAARNSHKVWFIVLLVVNTLAILDIIYIFAVGRPAMKKSMSGTHD